MFRAGQKRFVSFMEAGSDFTIIVFHLTRHSEVFPDDGVSFTDVLLIYRTSFLLVFLLSLMVNPRFMWILNITLCGQ